MRRMMKVAAVGAVGLAAGGTAWVLGMRDKNSMVVAAQRRLNKAVLNPNMLKSAGTPGAYASIVRHTGRTSGKVYATPVGAVPTDDGFVIALVYGRRSDWVRNVLAAGSAEIVHEGREYEVAQPELIPLDEATEWLPESELRPLRTFGVRDCLRVRTASESPAQT
jgi:deazaflavin-dependent oxidoreductase (nitroreductase family)